MSFKFVSECSRLKNRFNHIFLRWSSKKRKCSLYITILSHCFSFYVLKNTPLSEAARNGHTDIVRLLIENGADVNEGERVR